MKGLMKDWEVADYLGVGVRVVRNLTHKSKEIPFVLIGNSVRYEPTQVDAWLAAKSAENKTSPET